MKNRSFAKLAAFQFFALALAIFLSPLRAQAAEKVIFQFNQTQGLNPYTGVISDSAGNFYGTVGGVIGTCPMVYELSPGPNGSWTETVLYTFQSCNQTGLGPTGLLTMDKAGNLYGAEYTNLNDGSGQIYELVKGTNGTWTYTVIHTLSAKEGAPFGDLALDAAGNLYGATLSPFTTFSGEVFELSPQPNGHWKETVLITFPTPSGVGAPEGSVILDSQGNLYGATGYGLGGFGGRSRGGVFELSPQANGPWKLNLLYNFTTKSASQFPNSKLTFDTKGNLYGTAQGSSFYGSVFEVSPSSGGVWTAKTLHSFTAGNDGANTTGNLVFDNSGNLYGITYSGGSGCNQHLCGVVYKLTPQSNGNYKESIAHPFESASDGSRPYATLFLGNDGNLYGTTSHGGSRNGYGTVYQITP